MARLYTIDLDPGEATLEAAITRLGVDPEDVDHEYGLVGIGDNRYVVLVRRRASAKAADPAVRGPYTNPRIAAFGPTRAR